MVAYQHTHLWNHWYTNNCEYRAFQDVHFNNRYEVMTFKFISTVDVTMQLKVFTTEDCFGVPGRDCIPSIIKHDHLESYQHPILVDQHH